MYKMNLFSLENYRHKDLFSDCCYPWESLKYLKNYARSLKGNLIDTSCFPNVYFVNAELIWIGADVVIEPGAYIQGPCFIGDRCQIRHGAYIRGDVVMGDDCTVGHVTEVKHSILLNGVTASHFNYIGDSILGNGVQLGAGAKCANLRFDQKPVRVKWEGQSFDTGLSKLGALIADLAKVGCNCVLNPGTVLGRGALCFPCLQVQGTVLENGKFT
jgi:NDP-sugar pyrophosphorylase family protein